MASRLIFILAPRSSLPQPDATWDELVEAQRLSLGSGIYLRLFPAEADWSGSLDELIIEGKADISGNNPFQLKISGPETNTSLLCDSFIPNVEPKFLWLAVYRLGRLWATHL